jgi:WD40 repeat protein
MALSRDGKFLAVGHARAGEVEIWDPTTATKYARAGEVEIWDPTTATKLTTFSAHKLSVNKLEFSPDGRFLLTTGQETPITPAMINAHQLTVESGVKLWSVNTWTIQASLSFTGMGLGGAAFNTDGRLLALTNSPGVIELFDINQSKTVRKLASEAYPGGNMAFSPDGNWLALFSQQGIVVWNLAAVRPL